MKCRAKSDRRAFLRRGLIATLGMVVAGPEVFDALAEVPRGRSMVGWTRSLEHEQNMQYLAGRQYLSLAVITPDTGFILRIKP